jgi:hypothetical protein
MPDLCRRAICGSHGWVKRGPIAFYCGMKTWFHSNSIVPQRRGVKDPRATGDLHAALLAFLARKVKIIGISSVKRIRFPQKGREEDLIHLDNAVLR